MKKIASALLSLLVTTVILTMSAPRAEAYTHQCKLLLYISSPYNLNFLKVRMDYNEDPQLPYHGGDIVGNGNSTICTIPGAYDDLKDANLTDRLTGTMSDNPVVAAPGHTVGHCWLYVNWADDVIVTQSYQNTTVLEARDANETTLTAGQLANVSIWFEGIVDCVAL